MTLLAKKSYFYSHNSREMEFLYSLKNPLSEIELLGMEKEVIEYQKWCKTTSLIIGRETFGSSGKSGNRRVRAMLSKDL